jgi:hypothetical protein
VEDRASWMECLCLEVVGDSTAEVRQQEGNRRMNVWFLQKLQLQMHPSRQTDKTDRHLQASHHPVRLPEERKCGLRA